MTEGSSNSATNVDVTVDGYMPGPDVDCIRYTTPSSGLVSFSDGTAQRFSRVVKSVPCFTPGTLIATPKGERKVDDLKVGDRVLTRDNGIQHISWVGHKPMSAADLAVAPYLRPVLVKAGALGNGLPERNTLLSPNHRVLVVSDVAKAHFGKNEVLVAAQDLKHLDGISTVNVPGTTYMHFMCDNHEVVLSNGTWTETFQPSDKSLKSIDKTQREEIFKIYPQLATKEGVKNYRAARKTAKLRESFLLWR